MTTAAQSLIETVELTRAELRKDPRKLARLEELQRWQVQRLRRTYADYAAEPRYRDAFEFFVEDLYGPHDFARRDRDVRKVLHQWERVLPQRALGTVLHALELEALSLSLDLAMVEAQHDAQLDEHSYAAAYRRANRRQDRQRQIWLIMAAGRELDELIRLPAIGMALRMAKLPARLAGVSVLHAFLERGYAAFARMSGGSELLAIIQQRETDIVQRLFAGSADPFRFGSAPAAARSS